MKNIYKHISRALLVIGLFFLCEGVMWGGSDYFQAKITSTTDTGGGKAYVSTSSGEFTTQSATSAKSTSSDLNVTFNLRADPESGYHFVSWNISKGNGTIVTDPEAKSSTTVKVKTAAGSGYGEYDEKSSSSNDNYYLYNYTATATFAINEYYAILTATSGGNGTITVNTSSPQKGASGGSNVDFSITVTPNQYYHLEKIEFTTGSGTISSDNTKVTVAVASKDNYGTDKAATYAIKATFARDTYTVKFDKNSSEATGTMSNQTVQSAVETKLNKRQYENDYTVKYDACGGKVNGSDTWSESKTRFTRWKHFNSNGSEGSGDQKFDPYDDEGTINKTLPHGTSITLKATWANNNVSFTLPSATLGDRTFNGWYTAASGGDKKGDSGSTIQTGNATLYAQWGDPFYARINLSQQEGADGTAHTDDGITEKSSDYNGDNDNGKVSFKIIAPDAKAGYHWDGWQEVSDATYTDKTKQTTTVTVKTSKTAGESNKASYNIVAKYALNHYVEVNSATNNSEAGIAYVCYGSSFSGTSTSAVNGDGAGWSNKAETFSVKAEAKLGYHFVEWTITDDGEVKTSTSAQTTITAYTKAGNTGKDNPKKYTVTANFAQNANVLVINANCTKPVDGEKVVFNIVKDGEPTVHYRVSIATGGTMNLNELPFGTYTITPETSWSWDSNVTPDSKSVTFEKTAELTQTKTVSFEITSKSSTKKHAEASSTKTY